MTFPKNRQWLNYMVDKAVTYLPSGLFVFLKYWATSSRHLLYISSSLTHIALLMHHGRNWNEWGIIVFIYLYLFDDNLVYCSLLYLIGAPVPRGPIKHPKWLMGSVSLTPASTAQITEWWTLTDLDSDLFQATCGCFVWLCGHIYCIKKRRKKGGLDQPVFLFSSRRYTEVMVGGVHTHNRCVVFSWIGVLSHSILQSLHVYFIFTAAVKLK